MSRTLIRGRWVIASDGQTHHLLQDGEVVYEGNQIVFTGHDYAEGGMFIADVLKRLKVPASFFFTGEFYGNPAFRPLIDRLQRDVWEYRRYEDPFNEYHVAVQFSPDGVVREVLVLKDYNREPCGP